MIMFGITEILLSQIQGLDQIWWLSIVAAVMFVAYSLIGLGLGIAQVAGTGFFFSQRQMAKKLQDIILSIL